MKSLIWFLMFSIPICVTGQTTSLQDERDNQTYTVGEVNGQLWMLDNLNLETELSFGLSTEEQKLYPNVNGRWYHMNELSTVCPMGWRLPTSDEWIRYFNLLSEKTGAKPSVIAKKEHISITKFSSHFDLFEPGNPLNIIPAGIFQGTTFIHAPESADFWIQDLPTKANSKKDKTLKRVKTIHPGTSHIHLFNEFTNIHSHHHHLDPMDEENLRRFLVRCVADKEN